MNYSLEVSDSNRPVSEESMSLNRSEHSLGIYMYMWIINLPERSQGNMKIVQRLEVARGVRLSIEPYLWIFKKNSADQ